MAKMEYKIIEDSSGGCQKKLNQWKHDYDLEILEMVCNAPHLSLCILLTRTPKLPTGGSQ